MNSAATWCVTAPPPITTPNAMPTTASSTTAEHSIIRRLLDAVTRLAAYLPDEPVVAIGETLLDALGSVHAACCDILGQKMNAEQGAAVACKLPAGGNPAIDWESKLIY